MTADAFVGLADAIQQVRVELAAAMAASAGETLRFELGTVEVEFAMTVHRQAGGAVGLNVAVASANASGGRSSESLHRLTLTLLPKDVTTGRAPEVAGWVDRVPPR